MAVCVNCGKECDGYLCGVCKGAADLDDLCRRITEYRPGSGENPLWDRMVMELTAPDHFRNIVFALADELSPPRKEYRKILSLSGTNANVQKNIRPWLYKTYEDIRETEGLAGTELNRIKGLVLGALFMDYRYAEADLLARALLEEDDLPVQVYYNLADFYSKTRRYDEADDVMAAAAEQYGAAETERLFGKIAESNRKYREREAAGKPQYMPNPKENREEARKAYMDYLASIGIDAESAEASVTGSAGKDGDILKRIPKAIPKDQYPEPKEIRDADFDTFVAYDLETTGLNPKTDSIIEIGAVKVSGGQVIDSPEYVFQKFVKPYKQSLREEVTKLTGITKEDVKHAGQMWDVFRDFMAFADGCVLVGFNSIRFDTRFLVRAGRYANIIMENPQFDVMRYAESFRSKLGLDEKKISLGTLSRKTGVENPKAHRALQDAVTTARVFLKLKEMETSLKPDSVDDILSDLDNW